LYAYCYLFAYTIDMPVGAKTLTLPKDAHVLLLAAKVSDDGDRQVHPARPLLDEFKRDDPLLAKIVPAGGKFTDCTPVSIELPLFGGGCEIRYTLDGSEPKADSPKFEAPLLLHKDTLVKARLFKAGTLAGDAVEARFEVNDTTPPSVLDVSAVPWSAEVAIKFSEPLDKASAENPASYKIAEGVQVKSAALAADGRGVTLTLAAAPKGDKLTLAIDGLRDLSPAGNAVKGLQRSVPVLRPIAAVKEAVLDGEGGGFKEMPLGDGAPVGAAAPWTINAWLWIDKPLEDLTMIAGFGDCQDRSGSQRYLAKFAEGFHFWGSGVDVPAKAPLETGKWQMLTATFDGKTVKLFKDGREVKTQDAAFSDAAPVAKIGPPPPWPRGHRLAGKVAGFTLWNKAIPPESVATLQQLGPEASF
jgi:alpha-mannosidase